MDKAKQLFLISMNKLLAGLLTLLGFSLAACDKGGTCEYGSPYADYEIKGKVVDNQGYPIANIQIEISDSIPENGWMQKDTLYTDSDGKFQWKRGDFPRNTFQLISRR